MIYKYAIDFGTTNSSIALRTRDEITGDENTIVFQIQDSQGKHLTMPSVIYIDSQTDTKDIGSLFVGHDAKEKFANSRAVGKRLVREVKLEIDKENDIITDSVGTKFSATALIAAILLKLKRVADKELEIMEIKPRGVVMGVPVSFSDKSKAMLRAALVQAGFYKTEIEAKKLTEFVSEPVAVAVFYGVEMQEEKQVMVFDFGGGTLDIAILRLKPKGSQADRRLPHDVVAKVRQTIGGERITRLIFEKIIRKHYQQEFKQYASDFGFNGKDSDDEYWLALSETTAGLKLLEAMEELKCTLSNDLTVKFSFSEGNVFFGRKVITQSEFERVLEENGVLTEVEDLVRGCLAQAKMKNYDIDDVLLAGGSSLIPCFQRLLIEDLRFGPNKVHGCTIRNAVAREVLTSIVRGLAVYGCIDERVSTPIVDDIVDHDYGIWDVIKKEVSIILKAGTSFSETLYQREMAIGGCFKEYDAVGMDGPSTQIPLQVYEVFAGRKVSLGTINLNQSGSGKYKVFMRADDKTGCLVVDIFDRLYHKWYDDIPLRDREFDISK